MRSWIGAMIAFGPVVMMQVLTTVSPTGGVHAASRPIGPAPVTAFRDRSHAGEELARIIPAPDGGSCLVLALPRGGIAVGEAVAKLKAETGYEIKWRTFRL